VRFGHATAQIIGHQDLRCTTEKSKTADVGAQPVGQFLRPGGLGEGVAGGAEDGDEDLSRRISPVRRSMTNRPFHLSLGGLTCVLVVLCL
jgi:hypothetical protein